MNNKEKDLYRTHLLQLNDREFVEERHTVIRLMEISKARGTWDQMESYYTEKLNLIYEIGSQSLVPHGIKIEFSPLL